MISDNLLEYNPQWEALANAGIGGPVPYVAPKVFKVTPATSWNPYLQVEIEGGSYTDMMAATHRPLMPVFYPGQIYYNFCFNIMPDPNLAVVQALEFEASFADQDGYYYNNSGQRNNVNPAGYFQAYAGPNDVWANTDIQLPQLDSTKWTPVIVSYLVDTVGHTMSTLSVTWNNVRFPLPAQFQKIPGQKRNWTPGVYVQFQLDLASKGGSITNKYNNIAINWM